MARPAPDTPLRTFQFPCFNERSRFSSSWNNCITTGGIILQDGSQSSLHLCRARSWICWGGHVSAWDLQQVWSHLIHCLLCLLLTGFHLLFLWYVWKCTQIPEAEFSVNQPVVSVVFTWWVKPAVEALRRDKHKSGGGRWTLLSQFGTGSINEAPPVAPDLLFTSLNLTWSGITWSACRPAGLNERFNSFLLLLLRLLWFCHCCCSMI